MPIHPPKFNSLPLKSYQLPKANSEFTPENRRHSHSRKPDPIPKLHPFSGAKLIDRWDSFFGRVPQIPKAKVWPTPAFFRSEIALKLVSGVHGHKLLPRVKGLLDTASWISQILILGAVFPPKKDGKVIPISPLPQTLNGTGGIFTYMNGWFEWFSCRVPNKTEVPNKKTRELDFAIEWIWGWGLIIHDSFLCCPSPKKKPNWRLDLQNSLHFSGKFFVAKQNTKWRNGLSQWPAKDKKNSPTSVPQVFCKRLHLDQDLRFDELVWTCRLSSAWDSWLEIPVIL